MNSRQTAALPPVTLHDPRSAPLPLVFDSPHSGFAFPPELAPAAPLEALATSCDAFVDELYGKAPAHGCTLIAATFPRWLIDPNRARDDIDPELLAAPWPGPLQISDKSRSGMGLIRRLALPGVPVHGRRLDVAEVEGLIRDYYDPYHEALRSRLDALHSRFGSVWHVDCHSMKSRGNAMNIDAGRERPDFVIGNRDGSTCDGDFIDCVVGTLRGFGYRVGVNDPYKGAELVRRYSNPAAGRHSLQIEVNRALYMDETSRERHQGFAALEARLERLIVALTDFVRERIAPGRSGRAA
ncbi:MAG: N-formylglutamate amidohydrolase [Burkholderiales bacterium]|nr:N-formylglutamate amidohydrolase [Burkholderiales bacterium]